MNTKLQHKLITPPAGKQASDIVAERHETVLLFDCAKSNPNGDPDTGNMPRVQPDSLKGLVTDVCLKRKLRNFFSHYTPHEAEARLWNDGEARDGYEIFIRENAILQKLMEAPEIEALAKEIFKNELNENPESWGAKKKLKRAKTKEADQQPAESVEKGEEASPAEDSKKQAYRAALLRTFFDLRAFGGVISTEGPLRGSFYGQVRGPIQITFAESLDKILQIDATITRCAVASEKEKKQLETEAKSEAESGGNRTMGRKHVIDYGIYRCHIHFSPAFAAKTGFTYYDLDNFLFALVHMFDDDHAAGRHLRIVGLVDFQHQSALGNVPAHKLFNLVDVQSRIESKDGKQVFRSSGSEFPRGLEDYEGIPPGDEYHVTKDGQLKADKNSEGVAVIKARRFVWEIPATTD